MKIGIAISTRKRPHRLKECMNQLQKFMPENRQTPLILFDEKVDLQAVLPEVRLDWQVGFTENREGIASVKNRSIKYLYDFHCDLMFLFDDDCFPIRPQWWRAYQTAIEVTGFQMFTLQHPDHHPLIDRQVIQGVTLEAWGACSGCMMVLTRKVVEKVGYMDKRYGFYGYEHAGYANRVFRAGGLVPHPYMGIADSDRLLYCHDFHGQNDSSMPNEEKMRLASANQNLFKLECTTEPIYKPYEQ